MGTTRCARPGVSSSGTCLYLALAAAVALAGCATVDPGVCARFDTARASTSYDTSYRYSIEDTRNAERSFRRAAGSSPVTVRWYTLRLSAHEVGRCEHLYLYKDVFLERRSGQIMIEEQREFYTAEGKLVATKKEDLTAQLERRGYYVASVPLPIPEAAPAGRYRIVTRLVWKRPAGKDKVLATASAEFRVTR